MCTGTSKTERSAEGNWSYDSITGRGSEHNKAARVCEVSRDSYAA